MNDSIGSVNRALDDFTPNGVGDVARLYEIFEGFASLPSREDAIDAMFRLMERFPDTDLGSPGPLVHELEAIPGYEPFLIDSLRRQPANLTVWMANSILNSDLSPHSRALWLELLREVQRNPKSKYSTREAAIEFLEFQNA